LNQGGVAPQFTRSWLDITGFTSQGPFGLSRAARGAGGGATAGFGARPLNDVIHRTGYWALIFLMLSLAVTGYTINLMRASLR